MPSSLNSANNYYNRCTAIPIWFDVVILKLGIFLAIRGSLCLLLAPTVSDLHVWKTVKTKWTYKCEGTLSAEDTQTGLGHGDVTRPGGVLCELDVSLYGGYGMVLVGGTCPWPPHVLFIISNPRFRPGLITITNAPWKTGGSSFYFIESLMIEHHWSQNDMYSWRHDFNNWRLDY